MNYLFSFQKVLNHPNNRNTKINTLGRLLLWKFNQLFLKKTVIVNLTPEMKCLCYPDSSFGSLIIYTRFPEYEEMNFIYDYLRRDDVFLDVGANIGAHTLMAASKIKNGKIVSFEPSLKALKYLKENIRINHLEALVTIIDKVVSNKDGYEKFISGKHSEIDRIGQKDDSSQVIKLISSITLDKFLTLHRISFVDFIKIDVEGAEFKVMEGLKGYLEKGKIGLILFEVNSNSKSYGYSVGDIISFLEENNYLLYSLRDSNKISRLTDKDLRSHHTFNILAVNRSKKIQDRINKYVVKANN
ncbi:MAG: FkbM family methyltransferase [Microgenomates group bacterium]|jgi:FkbM family methyltransferase